MIFCQRCTARNSIDRSHCTQCGTPLLLVTPPPGHMASYDEPEGLEEHLIERISMLESEVTRLRQQNERLLDLIHRQATSCFSDHAMIDAIISVLEERGKVRSTQIESRWRELLAQYNEEIDEQERLEERTREILDAYSGPHPTTFEDLISEGMQFLSDGDTRRGIKRFEKALLFDPANSPLNLFLGEHFFFDGRRALARHYLEQVLAADPTSTVAALMLGVVCGDEGETESAKTHFESALRLRKDSFVAHYGLGRIHALEGRYREALVHFKRALTLSPSPEMHYLVGRAYVEQGRIDTAKRHFRKAIDLDPEFDAALYHLGLIYLEESDLTRARDCFRTASEVNPGERRYRTALTAKSAKQLGALPVFGPGRTPRKQSITSGDSRFVALLMHNLAVDAFGHGLLMKNSS